VLRFELGAWCGSNFPPPVFRLPLDLVPSCPSSTNCTFQVPAPEFWFEDRFEALIASVMLITYPRPCRLHETCMQKHRPLVATVRPVTTCTPTRKSLLVRFKQSPAPNHFCLSTNTRCGVLIQRLNLAQRAQDRQSIKKREIESGRERERDHPPAEISYAYFVCQLSSSLSGRHTRSDPWRTWC
jgi:hypothetical protein